MQQAQGEYDKVSWRGDVAASGQAQTLQSATIDYNSAKAAYDALVATSKSDASSKVRGRPPRHCARPRPASMRSKTR